MAACAVVVGVFCGDITLRFDCKTGDLELKCFKMLGMFENALKCLERLTCFESVDFEDCILWPNHSYSNHLDLRVDAASISARRGRCRSVAVRDGGDGMERVGDQFGNDLLCDWRYGHGLFGFIARVL